MSTIAQNIADVRQRIAKAALRAGRSSEEVTLVAVTKKTAAHRILESYDAGIRDFGENYVQEALPKLSGISFPTEDVHWHFIGHLQSKKARDIVGKFALVHSVDSLKIAKEISERATNLQLIADILLEVKLDEGSAKFGFLPTDTLEAAAEVISLPGIRLCGLMGMAPFGASPEDARPAFRRLRALFYTLPSDVQQVLSMGMSSDFEVAIEEGATMVRIGTALFGQRPPD